MPYANPPRCNAVGCKDYADKQVQVEVRAHVSGEKMRLSLKIYCCRKHATPPTARRVLKDERALKSVNLALLKRGISMVDWNDADAGWVDLPRIDSKH